MTADISGLIHSAIARAEHEYGRGNLEGAELFSRLLLEFDPTNAPALNILGTVCSELGLKAHAVDAFQRILAVRPSDGQVLARLRAAQALADPEVELAQPRYLLIKAWGNGFWSDVLHVLGCALLAEITGRIPVTHWGPSSLFSDGSDRDAFQFYFEPISAVSRSDLVELAPAPIFPPKWTAQNLHLENQGRWVGEWSRIGPIRFLSRPETVVVCDFYVGVPDLLPYMPTGHPMTGQPPDRIYRYLIDRYLKLKPEVAADVDAFVKARLGAPKTVAFHLRGSDKAAERPDLEDIIRRQISVVDRLDPSWRIFLMSDDQKWVDLLRERYGDRLIFSAARRTDNDRGIHYHEGGDRIGLARDVIIDTYAALSCELFVGNGASNVSAMVSLLKDWPDGTCELFTPLLINERAVGLHTLGL